MEKISRVTPFQLMDSDLSQGLTIEAIDKNLVWTLTTKDDTPATYTVPHLGGRPDDRS